MSTISQLFDASQRQRVAQAVAQAEARTAAEIVPVVARSSGRYDRAEDVAGLWMGLALMALVWLIYPTPVSNPNGWGGTPAVLQLVSLVLALVLGFFAGAIIADKWTPLRRVFTPMQQMRDEVQARARSVFFDQRVHHTAGGSGLLIYISLYEHLAVVLADQATLEKLGQSAIDEICDRLTNQLRTGDKTQAICEAIALAGEKLAAVMPRLDNDVNELSDALIVMD